MDAPDMTRRRFLGSMAAAGGCLASPFDLAQAKISANERLNLAFVGVGGRGLRNLNGLAAENVVALCDVDAQEAAEAHAKFPKAKRFQDFRVMLDQMSKQIDAVVISTPDHTHFPITMAAMECGKHVFCEKPLAHTVEEVRKLRQAAQYYGVVSQMGNQGHATEGIRYMKEWYEASVLGEVKEVLAWRPGPNFTGSRFFGRADTHPPTGQPIPSHLAWDLWRGPVVDDIPFHPIYAPRRWRGYYAFGSGLLGDWGCHTLDGPFWALDLGMPTRIESVEARGGDAIRCPDGGIVRFEFPARGQRAPVVLTWYNGEFAPANRPEWGLDRLPDSGMIMVGSQASLLSGPRPDSPRLLPADLWRELRKNLPAKTIPRIKGGHYREWTAAIRGDGPTPGSTFDYGARLTEVVLLGVIARRFGGTIEYDPEAMRIVNRPDLNDALKITAREGWKYGQNLPS